MPKIKKLAMCVAVVGDMGMLQTMRGLLWFVVVAVSLHCTVAVALMAAAIFMRDGEPFNRIERLINSLKG